VFPFTKAARRQRTLTRFALPDALWAHTVAALPFLARWSPPMLARLRELTTLFLVDKTILSGHASLTITPEMRTVIAAQACTLILQRDLDDYAGWENVIVHPDGFPRSGEFVDEAGVVHSDDELIAGEAWEDGPVLLSWPDVAESLDFEVTGMNLVIHEFAHKIDMRNGEVDGVPPLPTREAYAQWQRVLAAAYEDFCARVDAEEDTVIDPYASEQESEFFAVCTEIYVAAPEVLRAEYAALFREFNTFYKLWDDAA
jgi:MtfA peptidase